MKRLIADLMCVVMVVIAHAVALPLFVWRGLREGASERVGRAALLWDLMMAELLGAPEGQTVSMWMARLRPKWRACVLCRLLDVRWPGHCDDAMGVEFEIRRR